MSDAELKVPVPVDDDGFLRRECPHCKREFKWFVADDSEPDPEGGYWCPYCGEQADANSWFTTAQMEIVHDAVGREVVDPMLNEFGNDVRGMNSPGSFLQFDVEVAPRGPKPTLTEPNDMVRVDGACHPKEPVKVLEDWTDAVHCLICGQPIRT